jgi:hypothetical protein
MPFEVSGTKIECQSLNFDWLNPDLKNLNQQS